MQEEQVSLEAAPGAATLCMITSLYIKAETILAGLLAMHGLRCP